MKILYKVFLVISLITMMAGCYAPMPVYQPASSTPAVVNNYSYPAQVPVVPAYSYTPYTYNVPYVNPVYTGPYGLYGPSYYPAASVGFSFNFSGGGHHHHGHRR